MVAITNELKEILMGQLSEEDNIKVVKLIDELVAKRNMTFDEYVKSAEYNHILDEAFDEMMFKVLDGAMGKFMLQLSDKLKEAISGEALSAEKPNITH